MKLINKVIPQILFVMTLTVVTNATASAKPDTESDRTLKAADLYAQASTMEQGSIKRTELLSQSESILLDVIADNPESLDAHRKLMGVYLQKRDYLKAIETMQTAITLSPEDPKLYIALAILYDHSGAYEYAIPMLDQALALDPGQQMAIDYKATIQEKIKMQNFAMESGSSPHAAGQSHSD